MALLTGAESQAPQVAVAVAVAAVEGAAEVAVRMAVAVPAACTPIGAVMAARIVQKMHIWSLLRGTT